MSEGIQGSCMCGSDSQMYCESKSDYYELLDVETISMDDLD